MISSQKSVGYVSILTIFVVFFKLKIWRGKKQTKLPGKYIKKFYSQNVYVDKFFFSTLMFSEKVSRVFFL
jgi:hypothetical protein